VQVSTLICRSNLYLDMIFVGAAPALENNTVRLFVFYGRTRSFRIYERSLNFARSNEMSLNITLVLNDTMVRLYICNKKVEKFVFKSGWD